MDGDGDLDILFANVSAFVPAAERQNRLLINDGAGVYTDETSARLPEDADRSFDGDFVDVDGDGDLDIVTSNLGNTTGTAAPYRVYLNDGDGRFALDMATILPETAIGLGFDVETGDFNGDGVLDLYLASRGSVDRLLLGVR